MDIASLLNDKMIKSLEKRERIAEALNTKSITIGEICSFDGMDDKKTGIVLEAMEAVTRNSPEIADISWLQFADKYISSKSNGLKREASRVVGNIAHLFSGDLEAAITKLLENTNDEGTVIRWGSAYALGRIVGIPQHANSGLFDTVSGLCDSEQENGVKNQYFSGLKKANKYRK